jgi:hypothetical protein
MRVFWFQRSLGELFGSRWLVREVAQERVQKEQALAEATEKLEALEKAKEEAEIARTALEVTLQGEIARLRAEKDEQTKAIETKFDALNHKLKQWQKPQTVLVEKVFGR